LMPVSSQQELVEMSKYQRSTYVAKSLGAHFSGLLFADVAVLGVWWTLTCCRHVLSPWLISVVRLRSAAEKLGAFNDDSEQLFSELGPKFAAKGKQLHGIKSELDLIFDRIRYGNPTCQLLL
jgi:hypothetical protein